MAAITDHILGLRGWAALAVVFAVPALESSAFVGFLFPGEIAVLLGGVLAYEHRISLIGAIVAAVAGAIIGDSIGYEVGHRWGRRVLDGTLGRLVKAEHLDRAQRYLATRGGKAVFLGRFTAALRVLVPGMAGMAGLDYPTFLAYNAAGGALWATGFTLLGFAAGKSWRSVEHVAKRASLVLLLAAVLVGGVVLAARWAISHQMAIRAFGARQLERPWLVRGRQRYRRPLDFLAARLQRGPALGLSLTVSLAVIGLVGWGFGAVTQDVVAGDDAARLDRPILALFVRHREPWLTSAVRAISFLGSAWVLAPAIAVVGLVWWARRHRWRPGALLAGAYLGSLGLFELVKQLARRPRPPALLSVGHFAGYSFPSGHATQAVAVWGTAAALIAGVAPHWGAKVWVWAAAGLVALLVGLSRVYLGAHWPTDVVGGWALGALWTAALLSVAQAFRTTSETTGRQASEWPKKKI